jgi:hypothetical protein
MSSTNEIFTTENSEILFLLQKTLQRLWTLLWIVYKYLQFYDLVYFREQTWNLALIEDKNKNF